MQLAGNHEATTRLRPGELFDLSALMLLEASSFSTDRISARSFRRWLQDQGALLLVCESELEPGALLGYALTLLHRHGRVARLYSLAVDPALRGQRLGTQLLEACVDMARKKGFEELRLEVSEANLPGLAFYQKASFQPFGRRPDYYADGSDALRLRRIL